MNTYTNADQEPIEPPTDHCRLLGRPSPLELLTWTLILTVTIVALVGTTPTQIAYIALGYLAILTAVLVIGWWLG